VEVLSMLRLMLTPDPAKDAPDTIDTPSSFGVGRLPIINAALRARLAAVARQRPKSICTSLKDLCEL
jgi:hypothetical protein